MIDFRNVSVSFGAKTVFQDLNFSMRFSERIAILGESGSGKTTILRLILGLLRPDQGKIRISDLDITGLSEIQIKKARLNFRIVFQEGALFDSLNVYENVAFSLRESVSIPEAEIEKRVRSLLKRLDMEASIHLMPEELSGGMKRRVAIARALAGGKPRMMLYDEPSGGLDPLKATQICRLIKEVSEGESTSRTGLILVTHQVRDAAELADRFMFLKSKGIAFDGSLSELKKADDSEIRSFFREIVQTN